MRGCDAAAVEIGGRAESSRSLVLRRVRTSGPSLPGAPRGPDLLAHDVDSALIRRVQLQAYEGRGFFFGAKPLASVLPLFRSDGPSLNSRSGIPLRSQVQSSRPVMSSTLSLPPERQRTERRVPRAKHLLRAGLDGRRLPRAYMRSNPALPRRSSFPRVIYGKLKTCGSHPSCSSGCGRALGSSKDAVSLKCVLDAG